MDNKALVGWTADLEVMGSIPGRANICRVNFHSGPPLSKVVCFDFASPVIGWCRVICCVVVPGHSVR